MTQFLIGATLALAAVVALLAVAWRKGWLKAASQRLFDAETAASRQQGLHFLNQYRSLRAQLFQLNQQYQGSDLSLQRLPFSEAQQRAGEILAMAEDLKEVIQELESICLYIARRVSADAAAKTRKHREPTAEARTPSSNKPKRKFKEDAYYAVRLNGEGEDWIQKLGRQLNDLLERGAIDGVDFFAVPLEFMTE